MIRHAMSLAFFVFGLSAAFTHHPTLAFTLGFLSAATLWKPRSGAR